MTDIDVNEGHDIVVTFSHKRHFKQTPESRQLATAADLYDRGVVVGYENGDIYLFDINGGLVSKIQNNDLSTGSSTPVLFLKVVTEKDGSHVLVASISNGNLCQFSLPTGVLIRRCSLPFDASSIDVDQSFHRALVWGRGAEVVLLDLATNTVISSIEYSSWALPTFADESQNDLWLFSRRGTVTAWNLHGQSADRTPRQLALDLQLWGKSQSVDFIVDIKKAGRAAWAVAQRKQWALIKMQAGEMVKEISATVDNDLVSIISTYHDGAFGFLDNRDNIVWIDNGSVQLVRPAWSSESQIVSIGHHNGSIWAVVTGPVGSTPGDTATRQDSEASYLSVYRACTGDTQELFWRKDGEVLRCGEPQKAASLSRRSSRTQVSIASDSDTAEFEDEHDRLQKRVTATGIYKDRIVIGKENALMTYSIEEFLEQFDMQIPEAELANDEEFTSIKGCDSLRAIFAGTSAGYVLLIDGSTFKVTERICLLSTAVRSIELCRSGSGMKVIAVAEDNTVGVLDKLTSTKQIIPGGLGPISRLLVYANQVLRVVYDGDDEAYWNMDTGLRVSPESSWKSEIILDTSNKASESDLSLIVDMHSTTVPQISFRVSQYISNLAGRSLTEDDERRIELIMHNLISTADDSASTYKYRCEETSHRGTEIGVASRRMRDSFFSVPVVDRNVAISLQVGPFVAAVVVSTWVALGQSLGRDDAWLERHLSAIVDSIGCEQSQIFEGFAIVSLLTAGKLSEVSLRCLDTLVKVASTQDRARLVDAWYSKRECSLVPHI